MSWEALRKQIDDLEAVIRAHDQWCKDYNATIEAKNAAVMEQHKKQKAEHEEWVLKQAEAIAYVVEMFERMEAKLDTVLAGGRK